MRRVLVDTGPLVAVMSHRDQHHNLCVQTLRDLPGPMFSCWPVITEAAWLLRGYPEAVRKMLANIAGGFLELLPLQATEAVEIGKVMEKYRNIQPQLADAALVYLADRDGFDTIFTLDRRDFSVYLVGGKRPFHVIP